MLFGVFLFILGGFLCLNHCYKHTKHWRVVSEQRQHISSAKGSCYDVVCFGSMYAKYDFDFTSFQRIRGFNFGFGSQFLFYTKAMIKEYCDCINKGGVVLLVIADLVFLKTGENEFGGYKRYYGILTKKNMPQFSIIEQYIYTEMPLLRKPWWAIKILKDYSGIDPSEIEENKHTRNQVSELAKKRIDSWCRTFGLPNSQDAIKLDNHENVFRNTTKILSDIIDFSLLSGFRPVIVIPPMSAEMNAIIGQGFLDSVLYNNIKQANSKSIPVLDYSKNKCLQDYKLYFNADCLNKKGRKYFTHVVVKDLISLGLLEKETTER